MDADYASTGVTCSWKSLSEYNNGQNCVDIYYSKSNWGDHSCSLELPFICEVSNVTEVL